MQTKKPDKFPRYVPALDGLRGVAILLVILWHYFDFSRSCFPGWEGVDLFFVLSGYLITGRLQETKGLPRYFSRFYRNRALRILPLYLILVLFYLAVVHLFVRKVHLPFTAVYFDHWKSFFLFTDNWTFIFFGIPKDLSLVPLWSVAVEVQFYLVWPVLVFLTTANYRLKLLPVLITVILLGRTIAWLLNPLPNESIYYNSFFRLDCFCTGALLYQLHYSNIDLPLRWVKRAALLLLAIQVFGMLATKSVSPFTSFFPLGGYTVCALLFASLLHLATQPGNHVFIRFLQHPFLRRCGKISYGLYLVHVPIQVNIGPRLSFLWRPFWSPENPIIPWLSVFICLALSFLISMLSYRYFESRFLRLKNPTAAGTKSRQAKKATFEP